MGIIFLDPALVHSKVESFLKKIKVPAVILGADIKVFRSRKRDFLKKPPGPVLEVSFDKATHNDAQFPNMFSWRQAIGLDHKTDVQRQKQFAAGMVAAIYSLCDSEDHKFLAKGPERQ